MSVWRQKTSIVSKLLVKGERLDSVAARLHFERLFGADNFLPEGLPPKAIVCIKHLRDPLPRTLRLNRSDLTRSDAWRISVAREIEKLYSRAFRPVSETVPAQAESIVFADNSELLACLASDWGKGLLAENWWWQGLFPNLHLTQAIARIWTEAAEFAPFALQILAKQGKAASFVSKLQPGETSNLLRQIIAVFGLDKLQNFLFESFEEKGTSAASATKKPVEKKTFPTESFFFAPWSAFVPETRHPSLSFEQQSLLGIGLLLARAPRLARSSEFARQVKIFRSEFEIKRTAAQSKPKILKEKKKEKIKKFSLLPKKQESTPILPEPKTQKSREKKALEFFDDSPDAEKKSVKPPDSSSRPKSEFFFTTDKAEENQKKIVSEDSPSETTFDRRASKKETKPSQAKRRKTPQKALPEIAAETEIKFVEEAETDFEFVVETVFGGVFYLLNLGLYLNLYRDFTESEEAEIDLHIWDFVALLGLEFLGQKIKKDSIWKLLEWLAGRESDDELGRGFTAPDEWRVPPEWLKTFQTGEKWIWTDTGKRLVARHPAGFSVFDVPTSGNVKTQLKNELKIYGKKFSGLAKSDLKDFPEHFSPSENWLKNLTVYAQARLLQALNLGTRKQINRILFERRAKITVTATHLDVTFSLADLPFKVRLSGLDRNPSWIPAVGKFVNFHFI